MNASWQEFLCASGARLDQDLVADFGAAADELRAAPAATIVAPLAHLGVIEVSGADAASFLHQQLTSDVKHLADGSAQHSAWCSAKGRMLASFLVVRSGSSYHLRLSADLLPAILKRLRMFVLRSQVSISDRSDDLQLIGLSGPRAEEALQAAGLCGPVAPLTCSASAEGIVVRLDSQRFELVVSSETAGKLWQGLLLAARPVGTRVWQWLEIAAGVPLITDGTKEEFVPQMANFEQLGGVSFHKGCYPGQEIIARTQYLGKVKRHLYRAHSNTPIAAGTAIYSPANPEHACGMVANAAPAPAGGFDALAVVLENFVAAADLEIAAPGGAHIDLQPLVR
ncbi:MAG: folate-binding protein YgfZ [Candidatus Accumulibacter sp.]|jgi:folate-binding protein YgfZ|uniref:CAF17-like 4Fe-4S cluster assembly/insertion protein YgfZ n=1 Tax=unclassified Candidatus Accumulibacter TaxID=2619054 RepID=UPI001A4DE9DA|nr:MULTISPECIES: folate-binding protein YgfZ [unclassified Candidatus Accumulibacter]MBL8368973.1 folate-binding protein YgfZ [Accumulibacter sp.]MBN8513224.1 folate-binding protein YgfZ [Accumulibacter sp.]MBO3702580.1 folate-binding protein YgfZ [Accumulibacter sp.]